jgi:hypothetical protein
MQVEAVVAVVEITRAAVVSIGVRLNSVQIGDSPIVALVLVGLGKGS